LDADPVHRGCPGDLRKGTMLAVHELVAVQVGVLWLATAVGALVVLRRRGATREASAQRRNR